MAGEKSVEKRSQLASALKSGAGIFVSRLTGLGRSVVFAAYWGASGIGQAAYNTAFAIPNSLRMLFGEGAFSAAFVPMLTDHVAKDDKKGAWRLAERAISVQIVALSLCILLVIAGSLLALFSSRTFLEPTHTTLVILPIVIPYALLICVAGAFGSVLNSLKMFTLPSFAAISYNLVTMATMGLLALTLKNTEPLALYIYCGGALLSGVIHLLVLMVACRRQGFHFHFRPVWKDAEVRQLCLKMGPALLGSGVAQVNSMVDKALGLYLGAVAIGALSFSQNLVYLPVGIFGVAMGTVCLTGMSADWALGDHHAMVEKMNTAFRHLLFVTLPSAVAMMLLSHQIVRVLFQRGAFTEASTSETAWTFCFYLVGMPAFCLYKVAAGSFHARKDTATPVKVSICCVVLNLLLNLILMQVINQAGLALSTSICSWLNTLVLLALSRKTLPEWSFAPMMKSGAKLLAASVIAGTGAFIVKLGTCFMLGRFRLDPVSFIGCLIILGLCSVVAGALYLGLCLALKCPELNEVAGTLFKRMSHRGNKKA